MNRALDSRLRKVEEATGLRDSRMFVVDGGTVQEREAHIAALAASGQAREGDTFVYTGVARAAGGFLRQV
jgi:hypothetical protein